MLRSVGIRRRTCALATAWADARVASPPVAKAARRYANGVEDADASDEDHDATEDEAHRAAAHVEGDAASEQGRGERRVKGGFPQSRGEWGSKDARMLNVPEGRVVRSCVADDAERESGFDSARDCSPGLRGFTQGHAHLHRRTTHRHVSPRPPGQPAAAAEAGMVTSLAGAVTSLAGAATTLVPAMAMAGARAGWDSSRGTS
eukprot:1879622-Prymnesium_polylepis.2